MYEIIRKKDEAKGGITPEEKTRLDDHAKLWIGRIMRTDPIDPEKIIPGIKELYRISGRKEPRVIIVPSPFVGRLASGLSASVWHLRKNGLRSATRDATDDATDDATREATDAATRDATYAATYAATREATDAATYAATYAATSSATYEVTRDATDAATDAATDDATREATDAATDDATDAATYAATRDATYAATYAATDDATDDATREATDAATYAATYAATSSATYEVTRDATDAATDAAKNNNNWLLDIIKSFTPESIEFSIGCISLSWKFYQGGNMWGQYDSYLTAMRDVIGLDLPVFEKYAAWEQCAIEGGFRYMHEEFCMVSDFPEILRKDDQNRPHSENGPSHRWRDGFEIYHIHGVRFPKSLYDEVVAGEMPFEKILAIEDIDQRTQAMRFGDPRKFLDHVEASKLDERIKFTPDGSPVRYGLYRIPQGDMFTEDAYFLVYDCPSTGREYMSGVEKCDTVAEAMSWKFSCSKAEWEAMKPLVDES